MSTSLLSEADIARFDDLPKDERARVARLVLTTGCTLSQAISAIEATRPPLATNTAPARPPFRLSDLIARTKGQPS